MVLPVYYSTRGRKNLERLLKYLEEEWSASVKDSFIEKLNRSTEQVSKQTSFYYLIGEKEILVASFRDNRMDPDRASGKIKRAAPVWW